jgi:glycosyltransferase involved in cell wall biosynthesis
MPERRRIAYLSLEAPLPGQAAETHISQIIRGLEARGWAVDRFLARRSGASAGRSYLMRLLDYAIVQGRLIASLGRFDAIYVRSHFMALPAQIAARLRGCPMIHEINGVPADIGVTYPWTKRFAGVVAWLQHAQYRRAAALIAVTPGLARWASQIAPNVRVHVVSNAADGARFNPVGPRYAHDRPYVVFVGSLVRWHGIGTMISALAHENWPDGVDLIVAGDGIERELVGKAAARIPEPDRGRLIWLGRQEQDRLPALLRGSLASLVTISDPDGRSSTGVLPLKLYEAMGCGTPVIVTDLPGQGGLVREESCGLVIPVEDAAALAVAVAQIAHDPSLAARLGAAGAHAVAARHDWDHRASETDAILLSLATVAS